MHRIDKTIFYILIALFGLGYFVYLINDILTPFIAAILFAYFLAPIVDKLHKNGLPRSLSSIITVTLFFGAFVMLSLTISPVLYKQVTVLSERIQSYDLDKITAKILEGVNSMDQMYVEKAEEIISQLSGALLSITGLIFSRVIHSGFVAVHIISILLITPIVMFYLLLSWHTFTYRCLEVFPKKYRKYTNELFADINICISNLIRGQATVCLTLGVFYAIVFSVIGLESGIVLGIFSGILIFIPYLGALFSSFLCITIAAIQFDSLSYALIVGLTFAFGQTVESYFLTPTFIGRSVGLNPVWILFGLLSGGALFGLLGVLIALPLTATISVIIKFALKHYKKSKFYN